MNRKRTIKCVIKISQVNKNKDNINEFMKKLTPILQDFFKDYQDFEDQTSMQIIL